MANYNFQAVNRKKRLTRRKKEINRFIARCEAANQAAVAKGEKPTDMTRIIKEFKSTHS